MRASPDSPLRVYTSTASGGVLRVGDNRSWDLYAIYSWIDRGEADRPSTMLPIIDGGFDQQQVVLGVQHRFGPPPVGSR
jgi:hypothetical protein